MRCPHCGIHYMDGEKICPICGKRAGIAAARRTNTKPVRSAQPSQSKTKPSANRTTAKRSSKPQAAAPSTAWRETPKRPKKSAQQTKKKRGCTTPFLILFVIYLLFTFFSAVDLPDRLPWSDEMDEFGYEDDVDWVETYDYPVACMIGTWESTETGDQLTVEEDGSVTLTSGDVSCTADSSDSFFQVLNLESASTKDYESALFENDTDLTLDYPPEDYYYCSFDCYPRKKDGTMIYDQCLSLLFYLPREWYDSETPPDSGAELIAYRRGDYGAEGTFDSYILQ